MTTRRKNEVTLRAHDGMPLVTVPCTFTEIDGIRVAVHRHWRPRHARPGPGKPEMMQTRGWSVTEPTTGNNITRGWSSREEALEKAHVRFSAQGGADKVREVIALVVARQQGADLV